MPINYNNYTSIRLPTSIIVHDTFFLPRADAGLLALQMRLQKLGDQEHSHSGDQPSCHRDSTALGPGPIGPGGWK